MGGKTGTGRCATAGGQLALVAGCLVAAGLLAYAIRLEPPIDESAMIE